MKILQVNTVMKGSSVGRIMLDLYEHIEKAGGTALVGVGREPYLTQYKGIKIGNKNDFYQHVARNFLFGEAGFGSSLVTKKFIQYVEEQKPDIIHLHNIHGFYLQVELLFSYLKKAGIPVVWTLHDCWSFTGHCAYYDFAACTKWQTGCEDCVQHAKTYPYAIFKDNSINSYARKRKAFCGVPNLTIVTPSKWLKDQLKHSFLREYPVKVIPNGIDLNAFHAKESGKENTGKTKKILGVANVWEFRKGLQTFPKLATSLGADYEVAVVGLSKKQKKQLEKKNIPNLKLMLRTKNVEELVETYQHADVFVNATLEDNFPTTNLEALACGTPVVTYQTGGSGEAITDKSGIVVQRLNYVALLDAVKKAASGIFVSQDCVDVASLYDKDLRYQEYINLYEEILGTTSL